MFERYKRKFEKFVPVPVQPGKEQLFISEDGQVFSKEKGLHPTGCGVRSIKADLWNGYKEYPVSLLTLVAYGKLELSPDYYHLVDIFHIDGDVSNLHPSNLGYRYIEPIECEFEEGFYYIPFFNNYVINREGVVKSWKSGKKIRYQIIPPGKNKIKGGYRIYGIRSDVGSTRIGRYRLLALTFLPYPDNVDKLDVNHDHGVPGNDDLSNLEWATRSRNIQHAFETGLREQNITVYAKNVFTGKEYVFYSAQEAARQTNGVTQVILKRVAQGTQEIYTGGWLFKGDPNTPWREVSDPVKELRLLPIASKALSKNVFTGEIREHRSISAIGKELGLASTNAPQMQILKGYTRPYCGYLFKHADDTTPWPEFSERELAVFRDNPTGHARGVIARNEAGEELFFTNIINASNHFKHILKTRNDVIKAIARNRIVDGYKLTYL